MTTKNISMKDFRPAKKLIDVSVGDSVRIMREFNELTQAELSRLTGIPLGTLTAIECNQLRLDTRQSEVLAIALHCTPEILTS